MPARLFPIRSWHRGRLREPPRCAVCQRELCERIANQGLALPSGSAFHKASGHRKLPGERMARGVKLRWMLLMRIPIVLLFASSLFAQPVYDILLKGGHVIDPKNKISAARDVAIRDGAIAAVAANIPAAQARKVIDVAGLYVTPGLIDLHAHVYAGTEGRNLAGGHTSIFPDVFALRVGVTTV